jgi:hypothetical protein
MKKHMVPDVFEIEDTSCYTKSGPTKHTKAEIQVNLDEAVMKGYVQQCSCSRDKICCRYNSKAHENPI